MKGLDILMNSFLKPFIRILAFLKKLPKVPTVILLILIASAVFADFLALHDPEFGNPRERLLPPFWEERGTLKYPLGTDTMGRDILSRLIYGSRISLLVDIG